MGCGPPRRAAKSRNRGPALGNPLRAMVWIGALGLLAVALQACVTDAVPVSPDGHIVPPSDAGLAAAAPADHIDAIVLLDVRNVSDTLTLKTVRKKRDINGTVVTTEEGSTYTVGPALRTVVEQALARIFRKVEIYDRSTEATGFKAPFDVAIRPFLMQLGSKRDYGSYTRPVLSGTMRVGFLVVRPSGEKVGVFTVNASGSPAPGAPAGKDIPALLSSLLGDLRTRLVAQLPREGVIERWRAEAGIAGSLAERAQKGDVDAAIRLGRMHEQNGEFEEAEKWFCMAGEEGKRKAAYRINCGI